MKTFLKIPLMAIAAMILLVSCKKDDDDLADFDINNPIGYVILGTSGSSSIVYDFIAGNKMKIFTTRLLDEYSYTVVENKIKLSFGNNYFLINGNSITYYTNDVLVPGTFRLIKKPGTNQLAGKTFKGVYKRSDGSVLHPQFFYSFHPNANKVDAGFVVGTALRTENYGPVANVASRTEHYGPEYYEMLVLIDGKLYAGYADNTGYSYAVLDPL